MTIEFFCFAPSAPSRMVLMTLKALNLNFQSKPIDLFNGEQKSEAHLARNPRGKIPVIKDGDLVVSESRAIATYLCNQYEKGEDKTRLYPVDPKARAIVDQVLYVSESNDASIHGDYLNMPGVIFGGQNRDDAKITEAHKALKLGEEFLNRNGGYMAGDHLTLADFFMASSLIVLTALTKFNDFKNYPKTEAWLKKIKSLPYYDECNKKGLEFLSEKYNGNLEKLKK